MKSLKLFLLAFAATITIGAVAQDSVIPSRLKLQALRVGTGAVPASGNASVTGTLAANIATITTSATIAGSGVCSAANGLCPLTTDASLLTSGTLNNARLPAAISVTSVAATHTGDGSGLTALDAGDISAGTLAVARGGTNLTAAAQDATMIGNATTWVSTTLPSCSGSNGALLYNSSTNAFSCNANMPRARAGRINIVSNLSCNQSDQQYDTGATATPNATGQCTVAWGTAFLINPLCVVSPIIASRTAFISARTTTSATVNLADLTGTAVNGSVDFICVGI